MADNSYNIMVSNPVTPFTMARSFKACSNGKIFIGKPDTDPTVAENQIPVFFENEDGSTVQVSQPLAINSAGYPVYNGQSAKFVTTQNHSMAVYDSYMVQQFYWGDLSKFDAAFVIYELDKFKSELSSQDGLKLIGRCPDLATLATIEPEVDYQHIFLDSTLSGYSATSTGMPVGGGEYIYNPKNQRAADGYFVVKTSSGKCWVRDVTASDVLTTEMVGIPDGMGSTDGQAFGDVLDNLVILSAACKSFGKKLKIGKTRFGIASTWSPDYRIVIEGSGVEESVIFALSGFTSGTNVINYDLTGQNRYDLSYFSIQGNSQAIIGLKLGGTRLSKVNNILVQNCATANIIVRADNGGDVENLTIDHVWSIGSASPLKIGVNAGNITDMTIRDLQLVAYDSGSLGGVPLEITTNGYSSKQMFGLRAERVFTSTITGNTHLKVDSTSGGNIYGCTFEDFTGETHATDGTIANTGSEYQVTVLGSNTFSNDFRGLYHNAVNGNGLYVDGAHNNNFSGMRFWLAASSKYFITCANGAYDNHFKDFMIAGAGRRTAGVASLDLLTTQFRGDAIQLNKFTSPEITSEPNCILVTDHLRNISGGDFKFFPMTNKSGVDAVLVDQRIQLGITARTSDTTITIPYYLKAGDRVSLSMKYATTAYNISFALANGSRTFTISSGWGTAVRTMQTEAFNISADTTNALVITIPAATTGTFSLYDIHLSINGASLIPASKPNVVKQWY